MHFKTLLPILALGSVACAAPLERRAIVEGELGQGLQDGLNSGTLPKVAGPDGVLAGPTGEGLLTALTNVINGVAGPVSGEKVKRAVVEGELGSSLETGLNQGVLDKVAGTDGIIQGNTGTGLNEALTNVISSLLGAAQSQKEKRAIIEGTLGDNLNTGLNSGTLPKVAGPNGVIAGPTGEGLLTALTNVINGVAGPVGGQKEKRAIVEGTLGDNLNSGLNSGTLPKVAGPDGIIAGPTGEGLLTALTNVINGVAGPVGGQKEKRAIVEGTLGDNLNSGLNSGTLPKVAGPDGIIAGPTGEGLLTALTDVINGVAGPVGGQKEKRAIVEGTLGDNLNSGLNSGTLPKVAGPDGIIAGPTGEGLLTALTNVINGVAGPVGAQ